jgi:DNA-binding transcriptional LysR family regulator
MLDVSLDQLRTLAVVHATGTAQRAARALGREQSSVQKQLDHLNKAAVRLVGEALDD